MKAMHSLSVLLAGLATLASSSLFSSAPSIEIKAQFPVGVEEIVYNGKENVIYLNILNSGNDEFVLERVSGSFMQVGGREKPLRNSTLQKYTLKLPAKAEEPTIVPYKFYSQFKPQELRLVVWADVAVLETAVFKGSSKKTVHRLTAFDGQVSVVEPPGSWLDFGVIGSYLMLLALLAGTIWLLLPTLQGWVGISPQAKKSKRTPRPAPASPVKSPSAAHTKPTFEDEWIPDLHKKQPKVIKTNARANAVEVLSGSEAEGTATDGSIGSRGGKGGKRRKQR